LNGYQQAILMLLGVDTCGRFLVRCVDRWYIDAVAELFPTAPYLQRRADGKRDFWTVKSAKVHLLPSFADVTDWQGFCRGVVELQACLDLWPHKVRGKPIRTPRLRVYGQPELLTQISSHFPAGPKKLQFRRTQTGETCVLYYQSPAEVADILDSLHGEPCNRELWARWDALMQQNSSV
jgi:hypothetical protein